MSKKQKIKNQNGSICVYLTESRRKSVGTLVAVHGGPGGDHRGNEGIFDEIAMYCGDLGYNLAQFDMYGAGGSDGKPADITLKTQLRDYNSVVDYAAAKLRGPVHVVGESMGATIAALNWRADIASFVLLWPAFDLKDTDLRPYFDIKWKQVLDQRGYIDDNGVVLGREFLDEIVETDFSNCFRLPKAPCLLVHGKMDTAVPFQQSLRAVDQAAGESVLFAHPTGDHGLVRPQEREFTRRAIKWWLSNK